MKKQQEGEKSVNVLIFKYEAMSQNASVPFFEKTAFWQIAQHYHATGQTEKALTAITHALSYYHLSPEFHIFHAELCLHLNRAEEALKSLKQVEPLLIEQQHVSIYRIEAYISLGHTEKAIHTLAQFKQECTPHAGEEKVLVFSEYLRNIRKTEVMFDYLAELLRSNPLNEFALRQIYLCMEATGQYEEGIQIFKELIEQEPMCSEAWYNLGVAYQQTGDTEAALDAFEYALICDSAFLDAHLQYAQTAFDLGMYKTALQTYQHICQNLELKPEYLVLLGECYDMLNEKDISISLYYKALNLDNHCAPAHYRIGLIYLQKRNTHLAKACFTTALKIDPDQEEYDLSLAAAQLELGQSNAALKSLKRAFFNNPENPSCAIALSLLLLDHKKNRQALNTIKEAMEYHSSEPLLTALRGVCLIQLGKTREGNNWIKEAVSEGLTDLSTLYKFLDGEVLEQAIR